MKNIGTCGVNRMFLKNDFLLMNKDQPLLKFQSNPGPFGEDNMIEIESYTDLRPVGYKNILDWVEHRRAPKHRAHIEQLLRECGCENLDGFIRVAHALTLNDTLWVKEENSKLEWGDVSLYRNPFNELISHVAFEGGLYGNNFSTTSPEFGTDGAFAKCWIREGEDVYLLKRGSTGARNAGLEPYSEMYASQIAKYICTSYISYDVTEYRDRIASKCKLFTSEKEGFIPINKYIERANVKELLEFFDKIGSVNDFRRMLVLDAIIINVDRHLGNFGVIIDNDTMEVLRMAPVFDHNQSLLPYAENEEFENIEQYLQTKGSRIGNDFNMVAHAMLTPRIRADLINLKGFKFEDSKFELSTKRKGLLENLVNTQIGRILGGKSFYIKR